MDCELPGFRTQLVGKVAEHVRCLRRRTSDGQHFGEGDSRVTVERIQGQQALAANSAVFQSPASFACVTSFTHALTRSRLMRTRKLSNQSENASDSVGD